MRPRSIQWSCACGSKENWQTQTVKNMYDACWSLAQSLSQYGSAVGRHFCESVAKKSARLSAGPTVKTSGFSVTGCLSVRFGAFTWNFAPVTSLITFVISFSIHGFFTLLTTRGERTIPNEEKPSQLSSHLSGFIKSQGELWSVHLVSVAAGNQRLHDHSTDCAKSHLRNSLTPGKNMNKNNFILHRLFCHAFQLGNLLSFSGVEAPSPNMGTGKWNFLQFHALPKKPARSQSISKARFPTNALSRQGFQGFQSFRSTWRTNPMMLKVPGHVQGLKNGAALHRRDYNVIFMSSSCRSGFEHGTGVHGLVKGPLLVARFLRVIQQPVTGFQLISI